MRATSGSSPLHVLVWGGIDDLAQALHDAPDILPKLRVYFIGGPNKMWSVDAYNYIEQHHPALWIIEANATYRGWFTGGNQAGEWGNSAFVAAHVAASWRSRRSVCDAARGYDQDGRQSVCRLPAARHSRRSVPARVGWEVCAHLGRKKTVFDRLTTRADEVEVFGVVEFSLPVPAGMSREHSARMVFDGRIPAIAANDGRVLRFRFSPRDAKVWPYLVHSDFSALDGQTGAFTAVPPPASERAALQRCIPTGGSTMPILPAPKVFIRARKA